MHNRNGKRILQFAMSLSLAAAVVFSLNGFALAGQNVEIQKPTHHDVSPALRDIPSVAPTHANHEHPVKPLPALKDGGADGALQKVSGPPAPMAPTSGFDGVGTGNGYTVNSAPPDTNGSVGATQYIQWVNEAFAVFDKNTGAMVGSPKLGNTLWAGFGNGCASNNDGDPIILWDKISQRWFATQFSVSTTPYLQCIAVSTSADATGTWNRYSYSYGTGFNDYGKFGVGPDAYYATYNIFNNGSTFAGAKLCAFNRSAMVAGSAAPLQICSQLSTSFGGVLPADFDGTTPAAGTPWYFANFGTNSLNFWKMSVNWTAGTGSLTGPTNVAVASFSKACGGGTCIVQPGTSQQLDSLADRLMYRLQNMTLADGSKHLVVNHSVAVSTGKRTSTSGVRWYDINVSGTNPVIARQGTFTPDAAYRWMGSAAMDKVGNIVIGYSKSSSSVFPSVFYTVIPAGSSTASAETQLLAGGGAQQRSLARWGDYSAASLDSDGCTVWFTTEYLKANGTFNWSTFIQPVKVATCQ